MAELNVLVSREEILRGWFGGRGLKWSFDVTKLQADYSYSPQYYILYVCADVNSIVYHADTVN